MKVRYKKSVLRKLVKTRLDVSGKSAALSSANGGRAALHPSVP
jgi:hypothetical protein